MLYPELLGKKKKKIAVIQIGKEELKLLLCATDMLKYLENPKDSINNY